MTKYLMDLFNLNWLEVGFLYLWLIAAAITVVISPFYWYFAAIRYYRIDHPSQDSAYLVTTWSRRMSIRPFLDTYKPGGRLSSPSRIKMVQAVGLEPLNDAIKKLHEGSDPYVVVNY